jgi:hypothetical protein
MNENGGGIVNIIADMWKGFPMMRYCRTFRWSALLVEETLRLNGIQTHNVSGTDYFD